MRFGIDKMATQCSEFSEDRFKNACEYVKSQVGKLESSDLLYLYGRYKQATDGPCSIPRPGFFDFQGKQKWDAWHGLGKMSSQQAIEEYIEKLDTIDLDWEDKVTSGQVKAPSGMGVAVSVMSRPDEDDIAATDRTVFDFCKDSDIGNMIHALVEEDVNVKDDQGLALLHWACDRGHYDMVQVLLGHNAHIDIQDNEGQTALHYACCCDHEDIVHLLLRHGADQNIPDNDNMMPKDCTDNTVIQHMLDNT